MSALFWRTIKDKRWVVVGYVLGVVLFLWIYIAMFPSIKDKSQDFMKLTESYPEALMKAFNIESLDFTHLENFLAMEQFSFVWPILTIILMISLAGGAIAWEHEKGTIEILLSLPISRLKLFFTRYLTGIMILLVFIIFSIYTIFPVASAYNIDYTVENYITTSILCFFFGLAIYSLAMMFSAIFSEKGKVYFISAAIIVVMYVLNIIASLKESVQDIKYFSFFYYFNTTKALVHNDVDNLAYWVFIGVIIVCTIVGAIWFYRKDVAV